MSTTGYMLDGGRLKKRKIQLPPLLQELILFTVQFHIDNIKHATFKMR